MAVPLLIYMEEDEMKYTSRKFTMTWHSIRKEPSTKYPGRLHKDRRMGVTVISLEARRK